MPGAPGRLVIPRGLWHEITAHLQRCLPEEGCGLLGGQLSPAGDALVSLVLPVENILHSPTRFRMQPAAQVHAILALEALGLELLAIFHSHPRGPQLPSPTDRAEFAYPGVLSLILYPHSPFAAPPDARGWQGRAFQIDAVNHPDAAIQEVSLVVEIPL